MSFVVKISTDYTEATYQAQFIAPDDLEFVKELEGVGSMKFRLPIHDPQIASIVEWNKVELYEIVDGDDILRFSGIILDPEINLQSVLVKCGDAKRYLQKKIIFEDKSFATQTMTSILTTLVDESNARDGGIRGDLTFLTDVTDTITKDFPRGTTYFEILNFCAKQLGAEWDVIQNQIIFYQTIGIDRTTDVGGDDFVEFVYSKNSPNSNNISDYLNRKSGNLMITSLTGKAGAAYVQAEQNTANFGFLEGSLSFPEGDLSDQVQSKLDELSGSISVISIDVNANKVDFRKLNVGDLVGIRIEVDNPILDINQSIKVLKTTVKIINAEPVFSVSLGDISMVINDPANAIFKIDKRLKAVELQ